MTTLFTDDHDPRETTPAATVRVTAFVWVEAHVACADEAWLTVEKLFRWPGSWTPPRAPVTVTGVVSGRTVSATIARTTPTTDRVFDDTDIENRKRVRVGYVVHIDTDVDDPWNGVDILLGWPGTGPNEPVTVTGVVSGRSVAARIVRSQVLEVS